MHCFFAFFKRRKLDFLHTNFSKNMKKEVKKNRLCFFEKRKKKKVKNGQIQSSAK